MNLLINKLCQYDIEIHILGHFKHYYLRSKKSRVEVQDYRSKHFIDYLVNVKCLVSIREKRTQEVGGIMIRKIYKLSNIKDNLSYIDSYFLYIRSCSDYVLSHFYQLEREDKLKYLLK